MAVTGATGLIGSSLLPALSTRGHQVYRVTRSSVRMRAGDIYWNPNTGDIDPAEFDGIDVVVHLAGEPIARRWTAERRRGILESRVRGTELLSEVLARLPRPPRLLVSASAIGYYGVDASEPVDETASAGADFLAEVTSRWEMAAGRAREAGIRVAHPRFGIVLSRSGGALARMLPFFRVGLGGRLGSGRQWMSWISMHDAIRSLLHVMDDTRVDGPVNIAGPTPVQNTEFVKTLGRVLHRPTIIPVPAFALRIIYGAMADATVLASQRAVPRALLDTGFSFEHSTLEEALRYELAESRR